MLSRVIAWKVRKAGAALAVFLASLPFVPSQARAQDMTAGVIMEKMPQNERYPFVAGIVEGLAYARYARDNKQVTGMGCIYKWFYGKQDRILDVYQAFNRFKDHTPGAIVAAMVAKECN